MRVEDFHYCLPKDLIAQQPLTPRDSGRLMVLHRKRGRIENRRFSELGEFLCQGDVVVLNNTRVIPARLRGRKTKTGGKVEIFLLEEKRKGRWECLLRPAGRIIEGSQIFFPGTELKAEIIRRVEASKAIVEFSPLEKTDQLLAKVGQIPLPPYIKRSTGPTFRDKKRYQTVYAREKGAVAAPTAGLHFTSSLLQSMKRNQINIAEITLHTGWASFKPLSQAQVEKNAIPREYFKIDEEAAVVINRVKKGRGRVVAVGTTTTRALETQATRSGLVKSGKGWTDLFIYPGYKFKIVEALLTNFHMPRSSVIVLVAAFAGKEELLAAYREAIERRYRFLSFGDAMLIV
ncbi:MAG: tRNA preQ1(34) S-adenosylmethionine ribosyltransferase-isomerase QueA [bacterium]